MHKPLTRVQIQSSSPLRIEPKVGVVESFDWHKDRQVVERGAIPDPEGRAILLNSVENREELKSKLKIAPVSLNDANMAGQRISVVIRFSACERGNITGENVVLRGGVTSDLLCVGDSLSLKRGEQVVARLRVASPRWPCNKFDRRHGCVDTMAACFCYCLVNFVPVNATQRKRKRVVTLFKSLVLIAGSSFSKDN